MRILVIQLRQLGDILLTTPVVRQLKTIYPQAYVAFLTHKMGKKILDGNPAIDRIIYQGNRDSVIWDSATLVREMRAQSFDVAIDFMNNPRSALLTRLSGAPCRIGYRGARSWAYTHAFPRPHEDSFLPKGSYIVREKSQLLRYLSQVRPPAKNPQWEQIQSDINLDLCWASADLEKARAFLAGLKNSHQDPPLHIALSPTHRRPPRMWPLHSYQELARRLTDKWGAEIFWIWGPGEEDLVASCQKESGCGHLIPSMSLKELGAFFSLCHGFVGNSNGPSHVAVAAGLPSFQIHGPTSLSSWCPLTAQHQGIQHHGDLQACEEDGGLSVDKVELALDALRPRFLSSSREKEAQ